ncbi:recombination protein RecT [Pseudomonas guineae]|uniref:Recombination protein RecT n=1 Tax=Pseudomonas guineae TaxID=425504 RepID=A0A1I3KEB5_9PSED|nr:recombinase RecT [Pseudomonas guineae]SFI70832.1 recombination protein RecT [Pseudomonas guineae]
MAGNDLQVVTDDIYAMRETFDAVLCDRALSFEREAGFALQVLSGNSYATSLAIRNRQSLANAITNVAAIGISLNPARKQAYLVPRDNKICLDISYMGLMDLAMLTGSILWAQAELVYEKDSFDLNGYDAPPTHKYSPFATDRGEIVGVYVVIKTADGDYLTTTMTIAQVHECRAISTAWKAYLKDSSKTCPWVTQPGEMIKKTCVKRAYKYWPKTERLEQAIHHLNTDSGEGFANVSAPDYDAALVKEWVDRIEACDSRAALTETWKAAVNAADQARDKQAYELIKAAAVKRGPIVDELDKQTLHGEPA